MLTWTSSFLRMFAAAVPVPASEAREVVWYVSIALCVVVAFAGAWAFCRREQQQ